MAASMVFDFCEARKAFKAVVHQSAAEVSLAPCLKHMQEYVGTEAEKKATLDQAFRDVLRELSAEGKGCDAYRTIIKLAFDAALKDQCALTVPFLMLADLFDVIPLDECEEMFSLVEDRVSIMKSEGFYDAGKNYLLRMCNDILRRLSKSQNTVFCGRIQLFLSRLFPLSEKSGTERRTKLKLGPHMDSRLMYHVYLNQAAALNLMSQFNLENLTTYNKEPETEKVKNRIKEETKDESMEVEDGETTDKPSNVPIDYNLYRKFWALQDCFRKPSQLYDKNLWKLFVTNSDAVLAAFSSSKLDDTKSSKKKLQQRRNLEPDTFFAKYLTSEKLLDLQLNDSNFRRYVLVQFLILFQYINAPIKFKGPAHTTTEDMTSWMKTTQDSIYQLIKETPPDGDQFAKTVAHILAREESWNSWKNDGCPKYEKEMPKDGPKMPKRTKRRRIGDDLQSGSKMIKMGCPELTALWNLNPNNMDACKSGDRLFLPSLEEYFADAIEQNDPEAQVEEQYKLTNETTYQWKALRLLSRRSPMFFTHTNTPALPLNQYLNMMLQKLAKELPSQSTEEMKTEVGEDEEEIKENHEDDLKTLPSPEEQGKEESASPKEIKLNKKLAMVLGAKIAPRWKELAAALKFPKDDIEYFESENLSDLEHAQKILTLWMEEVTEATTVTTLREAFIKLGCMDIVEAHLGAS